MADTVSSPHERNAGLLLVAAAVSALVLANSPGAHVYHHLLQVPIGPLTVHHWIADALMAIFFLLVGLEVKREWYDGQLATPAARRLPIVAAVAGMAVPALVFTVATGFDPRLVRGWAIPSATDIAFALGILALIGRGVPPSLKLLLVTIAIVDDIGAVVIIAAFYTAGLKAMALLAALVILAGMMAMNKAGVRKLWPYLLCFAALWIAVFQSGVHATIAGVLAALTLPLGDRGIYSPLKRLEHLIHPWVMFGIVPLFGFASAGVTVGDLGAVLTPLPLGVALGLFLGKQVGVFAGVWLADRLRFAMKPTDLGWGHIYAMALLCGIGFTMSLFIGGLAFDDATLVDAAKIGTLLGSTLSVIAALILFRLTPPARAVRDDHGEADELFGHNFEQEPGLDPVTAKSGSTPR
jgi:NhaA family Na+:H+ antiporter